MLNVLCIFMLYSPLEANKISIYLSIYLYYSTYYMSRFVITESSIVPKVPSFVFQVTAPEAITC